MKKAVKAVAQSQETTWKLADEIEDYFSDTSVHLVQTLQPGQDDERVELDTGETL